MERNVRVSAKWTIKKQILMRQILQFLRLFRSHDQSFISTSRREMIFPQFNSRRPKNAVFNYFFDLLNSLCIASMKWTPLFSRGSKDLLSYWLAGLYSLRNQQSWRVKTYGLNPLNPNIKAQIRICFLYTYSTKLVGRICWSINKFHLVVWSCP